MPNHQILGIPYRAQEQGRGDGSMEATILTDGTHPMPETTGRAPIPPVPRWLVQLGVTTFFVGTS